MILHAEDPAYPTEADAEILGTGTLLCLILVTPMILLAYSVEGRKAVQSTSLDCLFSFASMPFDCCWRNDLFCMEQCQHQFLGRN